VKRGCPKREFPAAGGVVHSGHLYATGIASIHGCRSCIPVVGVFDPVIEELRQCLATRSGFVLPAVGCIRAVRAKEHGRRKKRFVG
jgi:hypothetical protein